MKKKRFRGHWCKVCGEVKANERFSGKGHRNHICKDCSKLSKEQRLESMHIGTIHGLGDSKKDRRQLHLFIHGRNYSERTRAAAMAYLEMLDDPIFFESEVNLSIDEDFISFDPEPWEPDDLDWSDENWVIYGNDFNEECDDEVDEDLPF